MRERVRQAHPVRGELFDVKHSVGAMVDAEFVVQYLVLAHAGEHPQLIGNIGNTALLQHAEQVDLLPVGVGQAAADAYRALRRLQHQSRLNEGNGRVPLETVVEHRAAIQALWHSVFAV